MESSTSVLEEKPGTMGDLFDEAAREPEGEKDPVTTVVTEESAKAPGFTAYWREYLATMRQAEQQVGEVLSQSKALFGREYSVGESLSASSFLDKTREHIASHLIAKAERDFAPPGGKLELSRYESTELLGEHWHRAPLEEFDPDKLWLALEEKYGGDKGAELGRKQQAEVIVRSLGLRSQKPVRKANRLELEDSVYVEDSIGGKGKRLSYHSAEAVVKLMNALIAFCEWAGDTQTAHRIRGQMRNFGYHDEVVSRQRFDMGGIGCVTYYNKFVWEVYGELGDKFQAFVATYGRAALESKY